MPPMPAAGRCAAEAACTSLIERERVASDLAFIARSSLLRSR